MIIEKPERVIISSELDSKTIIQIWFLEREWRQGWRPMISYAKIKGGEIEIEESILSKIKQQKIIITEDIFADYFYYDKEFEKEMLRLISQRFNIEKISVRYDEYIIKSII